MPWTGSTTVAPVLQISTIASKGNFMKVQLTRVDNNIRFLAAAARNYIYIDGTPAEGGRNRGFHPSQLLLFALGSCASFSFANMIYNENAAIEDLIVEVEGEQKTEGAAEPFTHIFIRFIIQGKCPVSKGLIAQFAKKAVYEQCSIAASIRKETKIEHEVQYLSQVSS